MSATDAAVGRAPRFFDPDRLRTVAAGLTRIGYWVLAAAFFLVPLNALRPVSGLTYGDAFLLVATAIAVVLVILRRQIPSIPTWLWGGAILLGISAVVAQAFPPVSVADLEASFDDPLNDSALVECAKLIVGAALLPIVVATIIRSWSSLRLLVSAWIAGVALSCAVAISDAYIGTDIQLALTHDIGAVANFFMIEPPRSVGLTVHPNTLSITAVMATPLVLSRMTDFGKTLRYYPILLLLLFGVLLSGARTGLIGILIAGVLTLIFSQPIRRALFSHDYRVPLTLLAGLVVTVAVVLGLSIQPSSRAYTYSVEQAALTGVDPFSTSGADSVGGAPAGIGRFGAGDESAAESDEERRQYIEDSLTFVAERPFVGYGFRWIESSHNIYLQFLMSGGILALVGFLSIALGYLRAGFRLRYRVPKHLQPIATAVTVSFAMVLIMGMIGNWTVDRFLYLPAGLIFAMYMIAPVFPGSQETGGNSCQGQTSDE